MQQYITVSSLLLYIWRVNVRFHFTYVWVSVITSLACQSTGTFDSIWLWSVQKSIYVPVRIWAHGWFTVLLMLGGRLRGIIWVLKMTWLCLERRFPCQNVLRSLESSLSVRHSHMAFTVTPDSILIWSTWHAFFFSPSLTHTHTQCYYYIIEVFLLTWALMLAYTYS